MLYLGGSIDAAGQQATALIIEGDVIAWLGTDAAAAAHRGEVDAVVELGGALVTAGFVDAHVHATSTGLTLTGLDLRQAASLGQALSMIEAAARAHRGAALVGHGWDETTWPEQRPPTNAEVDRASWGSLVYLSRVDVHSAVVSSALMAAVPDLADLPGYRPDGVLSQQAHHAVRERAQALAAAAQREPAQRAARAHAASLGIVALHEMAGPTISSAEDLSGLLELSAAEPGPLTFGYWGELASHGGVEQALALGAIGAGGDLFIDGAIGSRTACLRRPYADASDQCGARYLDAEEVAAHVRAARVAGLQAGFHVIGDAATDVIFDGLALAMGAVGQHGTSSAADRIGTVRLEHAEMLDDHHLVTMATWGMTASMQPMFDALWGGPGGMYQQRLGQERSSGMNRLADLHAAGVLTVFGSDSPVTEMGPWAAIRAATDHHQPGQRMSARDSFEAHTRSGWRSVGVNDAGAIAPGAPAHLAIWERGSAVEMGPDAPVPACLRTIVAGTVVHDTGELASR